MTRLLVHVEGETEEVFVNEILRPHLHSCGYTYVSARLLGNSRQRNRRGGIRAWTAVKKDIISHLRSDHSCIATTMVDYYALPRSGGREWPGRQMADSLPFSQKAATIEHAIHAEICMEMGEDFNPSRFVPYLIMHEFEGLLFSDCSRLASAMARPDLADVFSRVRQEFETPEHINDSPVTAPSKRIIAYMPNYDKPLYGPLAMLDIGLGKIRSECNLFGSWLHKLENNVLLGPP